jgi:glucose-6-phosphate isomerase, archaeal
MKQIPYSFELKKNSFLPGFFDNHIQRRLSDMKGQYLDEAAYEAKLSENDNLLYEVYEFKRPEVEGELLHGISIVHPGKVGEEYHMTKGHYHEELETAEIYYTLKGSGYMVMENPEGESALEELGANKALYVPPRWAHRSVNVSKYEDLVMFFVYPGNAGHDYGTIETMGFRKLVVEHNGKAEIIDNPRWKK